MRMFILSAAAIAILACGSAGAAPVKLKESQVRTVCGKQLKESSGAMGCEKECGKNICTYNCSKDKKGNAKDCNGAIYLTAGDGGQNPGTRGKPGEAKIPPIGGSILDSGPGLGTQGPAGTGAPLGGGKTAPPPTKIY